MTGQTQINFRKRKSKKTVHCQRQYIIRCPLAAQPVGTPAPGHHHVSLPPSPSLPAPPAGPALLPPSRPRGLAVLPQVQGHPAHPEELLPDRPGRGLPLPQEAPGLAGPGPHQAAGVLGPPSPEGPEPGGGQEGLAHAGAHHNGPSLGAWGLHRQTNQSWLLGLELDLGTSGLPGIENINHHTFLSYGHCQQHELFNTEPQSTTRWNEKVLSQF